MDAVCFGIVWMWLIVVVVALNPKTRQGPGVDVFDWANRMRNFVLGLILVWFQLWVTFSEKSDHRVRGSYPIRTRNRTRISACHHLIRGRCFCVRMCESNKIVSCRCSHNTHLVSSTISTSCCWVMGVLECPAVGSSAFSSPLVELTTYGEDASNGMRWLVRGHDRIDTWME